MEVEMTDHHSSFAHVPNGPGSGCSAFYFDEGAYNGVVESNRTDGVAHPIHNHMARSLVVRDNLFCATNDVRLTFSRCNGCSFVRNEIRTNGKVVAPSPEATPEWSGNVVKPYSGFADGAAGGGEELPDAGLGHVHELGGFGGRNRGDASGEQPVRQLSRLHGDFASICL